MYSLMFPLPLYLIEMRFAKSVLVSDFSFLANLLLISSMNYLVVFIVSDIVPLNASGTVTRPDPDTLPGFLGWSRLMKSHCTIPREYPMEPHFKKESRHIH